MAAGCGLSTGWSVELWLLCPLMRTCCVSGKRCTMLHVCRRSCSWPLVWLGCFMASALGFQCMLVLWLVGHATGTGGIRCAVERCFLDASVQGVRAWWGFVELDRVRARHSSPAWN